MKQLASGLLLLLLATMLPAASFYWSGGGEDKLWSNPANWTGNQAPGSNDVVYLANHCPDEPQQIILDQDAWLARVEATGTGARDYTITALDKEFIRLNTDSHLSGAARTANLTFNCDILVASAYLRVRNAGPGMTINGQIRHSDTERDKGSYIIAYNDVPLILTKSNVVDYVHLQDNGRVVVRDPHALGSYYVRVSSCPQQGTLVLQTNIFLARLININAPLLITSSETGAADISLDFEGQTTHGTDARPNSIIRLGPRGADASGELSLRCVKDGNIMLARLELNEGCTLRFEHPSGTANWGSGNYDNQYGAVSGPGRVIVNTDANVNLACTNCYSGGTYIEKGSLTMISLSALPTNGIVWLRSGASLSGHQTSKTHEFASLAGAGTLTLAKFILTRSLEIGDDGAPGTLAITSSGKLELGPDCVTTFKLDALDGVNDHVSMLHSSSNLTLDGTLRIVNQGNLETGRYKLFDLAGAGRVFGAFKKIEMPPASSGEIEIDSGGDVILKVTREYGTILSIR